MAIAVAGGYALPAIIESYVMPYLPTVLTGNTAGRWIVRVGIVSGAAMLAKRFIGPRIGNAILIGGGAYLVIQALKEFAPGLLPAGVGAQPLLGYYNDPYALPSGMGAYSGTDTFALQAVPDRLDPQNRY
jgi:hypothetical protein